MLNEDDIEKLAKLASLKITEEQRKKYTSELSNILNFMADLNKIPVENVAPTSHVHGSTNFFRDDVAQPSMDIKDGLQNAPDKSGRFIRVPIIIDQNTEH